MVGANRAADLGGLQHIAKFGFATVLEAIRIRWTHSFRGCQFYGSRSAGAMVLDPHISVRSDAWDLGNE